MKTKIKIIIPIAVALFVVCTVTVICISALSFSQKSVSDIVGKELELKKAAEYCYSPDELNASDDISGAYLNSATITVLSVDPEENTAVVSVCSPPIGKILTSYMAYENNPRDFDSKTLSSAIKDFPDSDKITTTLTCPVIITEDGEKLIVTDELYTAIFPEINEFYKEILTRSVTKESD
ncbi:MAG: hypothetical protein IJ025_00740 [Clostridia bacterium]|nr:hypothetical protein [Clostridia bacterium]